MAAVFDINKMALNTLVSSTVAAIKSWKIPWQSRCRLVNKNVLLNRLFDGKKHKIVDQL